MFAIPTLSYGNCVEFTRSMHETSWRLTKMAIDHSIRTVGGNSFVAMARNSLVSDFLEDKFYEKFTDFFFIDDDVGWPPDKAVEFLLRDEDIVAGVYPRKYDPIDYPCSLMSKDGCLIENGTGLVQATGVPTGFMRIKRHVLEKMYADSPTYTEEVQVEGLKARRHVFRAGFLPEMKRFYREDADPTDDAKTFAKQLRGASSKNAARLLDRFAAQQYDKIPTICGEGGWRGEDFQFCADWIQRYGGEIWVDPNIDFTHRGTKMWKGNLYGRIQEMAKEQAAKEALEASVQLGLIAAE